MSPPGPGPTAPEGQVSPQAHPTGWGGWGAPLAEVQGRRAPTCLGHPGRIEGSRGCPEDEQEGTGGQVQVGLGEGRDPGAPQLAHSSSAWQLFS